MTLLLLLNMKLKKMTRLPRISPSGVPNNNCKAKLYSQAEFNREILISQLEKWFIELDDIGKKQASIGEKV